MAVYLSDKDISGTYVGMNVEIIMASGMYITLQRTTIVLTDETLQ